MEFIEYLILILIIVVVLVGVVVLLLTRYGLMKPATDSENALVRLKHIHEEELKAISDTKNVEIAN